MRRLIWGASLTLIAVIALWHFQRPAEDNVVLFEPSVPALEPAPPCPWRNPEEDLHTFFPNATRQVPETRVLSARRVELTKLLGRLPDPEENALFRHRIFAGSESIGFVLVRRIKGEHGGLEIVLALNRQGAIEGLALQRMREPENIARELRDPNWLASFRGRKHHQGWDGDDLRQLSPEARKSALAIREGVRSLLVLQAVAEGISE